MERFPDISHDLIGRTVRFHKNNGAAVNTGQDYLVMAVNVDRDELKLSGVPVMFNFRNNSEYHYFEVLGSDVRVPDVYAGHPAYSTPSKFPAVTEELRGKWIMYEGDKRYVHDVNESDGEILIGRDRYDEEDALWESVFDNETEGYFTLCNDHVQSTLPSSAASAIINGQLLRDGDRVDGNFQSRIIKDAIVEISGGRIHFIHENLGGICQHKNKHLGRNSYGYDIPPSGVIPDIKITSVNSLSRSTIINSKTTENVTDTNTSTGHSTGNIIKVPKPYPTFTEGQRRSASPIPGRRSGATIELGHLSNQEINSR